MGSLAQTAATSAADVGLRFIDRYARASVHNEFRFRRLPAGFDSDDLVTEIHLALCQTLGSSYTEQIGTAVAARFEGEPNRELKRTLDLCVRRGIGRPQWASNKRLQRERRRGRRVPRQVSLECTDLASRRQSCDHVIDLATILESFDEQRRVIWHGLVAGKTLREIGTELGLSHQQVHRRSLEVLSRVARYFATAG
jgi:DNA-binding NarL/FixJ family response regulator